MVRPKQKQNQDDDNKAQSTKRRRRRGEIVENNGADSRYSRITFQDATGTLTLSHDEMVFQSSKISKTIRWGQVTKCQSNPPSHAKALLKVKLTEDNDNNSNNSNNDDDDNNSSTTLLFQLPDRATQQQLKDDIDKRRLKSSMTESKGQAQKDSTDTNNNELGLRRDHVVLVEEEKKEAAQQEQQQQDLGQPEQKPSSLSSKKTKTSTTATVMNKNGSSTTTKTAGIFSMITTTNGSNNDNDDDREGEEDFDDGKQQSSTNGSIGRRRFILCGVSCCGCLVCLLVVGIIAAIIISHISLQEADYVTYVPEIDEDLLNTIHNDNNNNNNNADDNKVIIVGGGTSGLFAAYTLQYLNIPYVLLEASNRFGGRVKRMEDFVEGVPLDMGAEWIHTNPQILQDLLLRPDDKERVPQEVEVMEYQPQTYSYWRNDYRYRRDWMRWFYKEYKFLKTTWSQYLEDYVVQHIQENIIYDAVVEEVDYNDNDRGVVVTTRDGIRYTGNQVIMAVPLKILQDEDIYFTPSLPRTKRDALDELWWAPGIKIFIEFRDKFYTDNTADVSLIDFAYWSNNYGEERLYFDGLQGKHDFITNDDQNVMTVFAVGEPAEDWTWRTNDGIFRKVMAQLDMLYDGQASQNYIKHRIQNWVNEPYIRGAYALEGPENGIAIYEEPVGNKIYFAFDTDATVHSAAISGRKAAVMAAKRRL